MEHDVCWEDDVWMILDGEMTQHRRAFLAAEEAKRARFEQANTPTYQRKEQWTQN